MVSNIIYNTFFLYKYIFSRTVYMKNREGMFSFMYTKFASTNEYFSDIYLQRFPAIRQKMRMQRKHKKPIKHLSTIEVSFTAKNAVRLNDTSGFT